VSVTRPLLRYFGGKFRMAPWIIDHFPTHRTYTETFGGAASVLLLKPRAYAEVYNDLDGEVVHLFRVLQDEDLAEQLSRLLYLTPYAREEFEQAYEPSVDTLERARRTLIKSFMGFGSNAIHVPGPKGRGFNTRLSTGYVPGRGSTGFRADASRSGTTPAHDWRHFVDALPAIIERLRGVVIENRDALEVLQRFDRGDALHYVDPPYVHATRSNARRDSYRHELTDDQHRDLAEVLHGLGGMVVLSGFQSDLYDELYEDWRAVTKPARGDRARPMIEVLWLNDAASSRLEGRLDFGRAS